MTARYIASARFWVRSKQFRDYLVQNFAVDDTRTKTMGLGKSKASGDGSKIQTLVY